MRCCICAFFVALSLLSLSCASDPPTAVGASTLGLHHDDNTVSLCMAGYMQYNGTPLGAFCEQLPGVIRHNGKSHFRATAPNVAFRALIDALDTNDDGDIDEQDTPKEVWLVGHSWGGMNVIKVARLLSERDDLPEPRRTVHRVVVFDPYKPGHGLGFEVTDNIKKLWVYRQSKANSDDCSMGSPGGPYEGLAPLCTRGARRGTKVNIVEHCRDYDFDRYPDTEFEWGLSKKFESTFLGKEAGHCKIVRQNLERAAYNLWLGEDYPGRLPRMKAGRRGWGAKHGIEEGLTSFVKCSDSRECPLHYACTETLGGEPHCLPENRCATAATGNKSLQGDGYSVCTGNPRKRYCRVVDDTAQWIDAACSVECGAECNSGFSETVYTCVSTHDYEERVQECGDTCSAETVSRVRHSCPSGVCVQGSAGATCRTLSDLESCTRDSDCASYSCTAVMGSNGTLFGKACAPPHQCVMRSPGNTVHGVPNDGYFCEGPRSATCHVPRWGWTSRSWTLACSTGCGAGCEEGASKKEKVCASSTGYTETTFTCDPIACEWENNIASQRTVQCPQGHLCQRGACVSKRDPGTE